MGATRSPLHRIPDDVSAKGGAIAMSAIVGHKFKAWDGHTYICDSYDPAIGYWMTRDDAPVDHRADTEGKWRRNVSERAIGRTYHHVHSEDGGGRTG
jgi:hypothetical protein